MAKTIKLIDYISQNKGITPEEGKKIYDLLLESIKASQIVTLDFENVELLTTAYLNVAIGGLYKDYSSDQLRPLLKFENITNDIALRIKKVVENAKVFYQDKESYQHNINNVLNGCN